MIKYLASTLNNYLLIHCVGWTHLKQPFKIDFLISLTDIWYFRESAI